jgi:hypothetical protein
LLLQFFLGDEKDCLLDAVDDINLPCPSGVKRELVRGQLSCAGRKPAVLDLDQPVRLLRATTKSGKPLPTALVMATVHPILRRAATIAGWFASILAARLMAIPSGLPLVPCAASDQPT